MKQKIVQFVKKPIVILSFFFIVMILFNAYIFGFKKLMANEYNRGVIAGTNQINNAVMQQFLQTGKLGINVPLDKDGKYSANGEIKTIILVPQ